MADFPVVIDDFKNVIPDPTSSLCGNFVKALLKLPVLLYKFLKVIIDSDGNLTVGFKNLIIALTQQPGDIKISGANATPSGWLPCDGSAVARTTYAALFAVIGETFGPGDGVNTFKVPDLRGHYPLGRSSTYTLGEEVNVGANDYKHKIVVAELPAHKHWVGVSTVGETVPSEPGELYTDGDAVRFRTAVSSDKAAITRTSGPDIPAPADQQSITLPLPPSVAVAFYIKT